MPLKMTNPKQIAEVMTIRKLQKELDKTKKQLIRARKQIKTMKENFECLYNAACNGKD